MENKYKLAKMRKKSNVKKQSTRSKGEDKASNTRKMHARKSTSGKSQNFPPPPILYPSQQLPHETPNGNRETTEEAKRRFEVECEFVQCLANPHYLNYLAQRGYFKEKYVVNYLKYLLYFKRPEYAKMLKFPQCIFFLEALQSAEFREAMLITQNAKYIEDQQLLQWHFYIRKRQRLQQLSQQDDAESATDQNTNDNQNTTDTSTTVPYLPPPKP